MTARLWDGTGPVLADTSAWMQARRDGRARDLLLSAIERGDVLWCWPVRYELMVDARGSEGIAAVVRELAAAGSHGSHRFPLTDLGIAAAAQDAGIGILHFDQHLEHLGDHLGVGSHWISNPHEGDD